MQEEEFDFPTTTDYIQLMLDNIDDLNELIEIKEYLDKLITDYYN